MVPLIWESQESVSRRVGIIGGLGVAGELHALHEAASDSSKARQLLDWTPKFRRLTQIKHAWAWFRDKAVENFQS